MRNNFFVVFSSNETIDITILGLLPCLPHEHLLHGWEMPL